MGPRVVLQLLAMVAGGGLVAFAYLAALRWTLFGRVGDRLPLLGAIAGFIAMTALGLGALYVVAGSHAEMMLLALAGFGIVRAVAARRIFESSATRAAEAGLFEHSHGEFTLHGDAKA